MTCKKIQQLILEGNVPSGHLAYCNKCADFYRHVQFLHHLKFSDAETPQDLKKRTLSVCRQQLSPGKQRPSFAQRLNAVVHSTEFVFTLGLAGLTAISVLSCFATSGSVPAGLYNWILYLLMIFLMQNIFMMLFGPLLLLRGKHNHA
ncbi:hypothetical protein JW935_09340 [candidate division KSB1 bacterium]|nr:hypothetical protein [candidate division KSB1 bacterium]